VLAEIETDQAEGCYPMIPSGAAHNEILLGPNGGDVPAASSEDMTMA